MGGKVGKYLRHFNNGNYKVQLCPNGLNATSTGEKTRLSHRCKASSIRRAGSAAMKSTAVRPLALARTLGAGLLLGGCAATAPTGAPPPAQPVPTANVQKIQAWKDAEMLAARDPGRTALVGGGTSMNPVYGDNTMLVAVPIDFKDLQAGMYVVYLNRNNRRVAHRLVAKESKGWRAQGLNNPEEDTDLVTPENLIGVIYASLTPEADAH